MNKTSVHIQLGEDRQNMVTALINAGYKVWVEEREAGPFPSYRTEYWVWWESEGE